MIIKTLEIDFYYLTKPEELSNLVKLIEAQSLLACDTETYPDREKYGIEAEGLDPHTANIRLIQVNWIGNEIPYLVDLKKLGIESCIPLIKAICACPLVCFFNMPFDNKQLRSAFNLDLDDLENFECTRVSFQQLGVATGYKAGRTRGYSYRALVRDIYSQDLSKAEQNSNWSYDDLSKSQLTYAALDVGAHKDSGHTSYLAEAHQKFKELLLAPIPKGYGVSQVVYDIEQSAARFVADMEFNGIPVNSHTLITMLNTLSADLEAAKKKVCNHLSINAQPRLSKDLQGNNRMVLTFDEKATTLLNSPKALVPLLNKKLQNTGQQLDNAQAESLEAILKTLRTEIKESEAEPEPEFLVEEDEEEDISFGIQLIDDVLNYKKLAKMLDKNWLSLINVETGNIHAGYNAIGTSTKRMSSSGKIKGQSLNMQQVPNTPVIVEIEDDRLFLY